MKKLLILTICAFAGIQTAFAQLEIVPKAGVNYAYFNEEMTDHELDGSIGYQAGVDLRVGNRFYLSPGVYYIHTSNKIELLEIAGTDVVSVDFNMNGLRVPFVIGGKIADGDMFDVRIFGGAAATFLLGEDDALDEIEDVDTESSIWGLSAGAGFDIGRSFTLELRHEWGMSDFFTFTDEKNRQNVFLLSAGIRF